MAESTKRYNHTVIMSSSPSSAYLEGMNNDPSPASPGRLVRPRSSVPGEAENVFTLIGDGDRSRSMVIVENPYLGQDIYSRIEPGEYMMVRQGLPGDVLLLRLLAGTSVQPGDFVMTADYGFVQPISGTPSDGVIVGMSNDYHDRSDTNVNSRFSVTLV